MLNGHYQYFGVIFNYRSLRVFKACVVKDWRKVLGKRSQKGCMNWANYRELLIAFPLPEPLIHQGICIGTPLRDPRPPQALYKRPSSPRQRYG